MPTISKRKPICHYTDNISYNGFFIEYEAFLSKRKTLSIIIYPNKKIKVRAPYRTSQKYISKAVLNRADWIIQKLEFFKNRTPNIPQKRNYEAGEIFKFLGQDYRLNIVRDLVNKVTFDENSGVMTLQITTLNKTKIKNLIEKYYRDSAIKIFLERLEICKEMVLPIGIKYNGTPTFRKMKSKWGSCSRRGEIKLSYELIKTPIASVDYVIIHELCHLREFNHSKNFYSLLDVVIPDWKIHKNNLRYISEQFCE